MYIKDAVFGNVTLSKTAVEVIATRDFQRLRYIKQLGFDFLVYPGAVHTRLEHSLGTYHVTNELLRNINGESNEELGLAGLLHDVGHAPFSHSSDRALAKFLHTTHEKIGEEKIRKGSIADIVEKQGLSLKRVLRYFRGIGLGELITGTLGSDRVDYLMRDSLHTGVAYGIIDFNRIKGKLTLYRGRPAIYSDGVQGAESLLIARYFMQESVYGHHAASIANQMYIKALRMALDNSAFDPRELFELDDSTVFGRISEFVESRKLVEDILSRHLFKRAYHKRVYSDIREGELEEAIERAGLRPNEYIVEIGRTKDYGDDILVVDKERNPLGRINDMSPLIKTLGEVHRNKRMLLIAAEKRKVDIVKRAIQRIVK